MKTIRQLKDNAAEGLAKGDVRQVDDFSAKVLVDRGDAEEVKDDQQKPAEPAEPVKTIDDIVDPQVARNRRQMVATIVGGPGTPATSEPATDDEGHVDADAQPDTEAAGKTPTPTPTPQSGAGSQNAGAAGKAGSEVAPPGANPVGGASGGGKGGSQ